MELQFLKLTVDKGVATVLLNRPEKGNSLSPDMLGEIGDLFLHLKTREDVTVIVLTGGEKIFSAGFDLDFVKEIKLESNGQFVANLLACIPLDQVLRPARYRGHRGSCHGRRI